jgi:hypothetical protein
VDSFFAMYPEAPDGFKSLGIGNWIPYFEAKATKNNSRFDTGPPVQVVASEDGKYPDFLPVKLSSSRPRGQPHLAPRHLQIPGTDIQGGNWSFLAANQRCPVQPLSD